MKKQRKKTKRAAPPLYVAEIPQGCSRFLKRELSASFEGEVRFVASPREDEVCFHFTGPAHTLARLRRAHGVYRAFAVKVARPRGILESGLWDQFVGQLSDIRNDNRALKDCTSFRIRAAGADSDDFQRIRERLAKELDLHDDPERGELVIRFRRGAAKGWEALVRLTTRPLSVRPWRVADMPGALDSALARIVLDLLQISPDHVVLNAMCGSGTLLIEQALASPARLLLGAEINPGALEMSRRNIAAARAKGTLLLAQCDACLLPYRNGSIDRIVADLPWGERIKSAQPLRRLYREFLVETVRIAKPGARIALVTQDRETLERALEESGATFELLELFQTSQGGFHPWICLLAVPSATVKRPERASR